MNNETTLRKVSAKDFKQQTGKWQDLALQAPVTITKHDRPTFVLLSFEEYQRLTGATRRVMHASMMTDDDIAALQASRMPSDLDYLNEELE